MKKSFVLAFCFVLCHLTAQEKTRITVEVPNATDEVFIVGNQKNLGDWQPDKVMLQKVSPTERSIELDLTFPAEYKFTRGNWNSEAVITQLSDQSNFILRSKPAGTVRYKIQGWTDEITRFATFSEFLIRTVHSDILDQDRRIYISLPETYSAAKKYPVVYITDAQNLHNFEIAAQTLRQQNRFGNFPETILIGIYQSDRNADFGLTGTGYNKKFEDFIRAELIPFVEKNYSTSKFRALIGHSNGSEYNHFVMFSPENPFDAFANLSEEVRFTLAHLDRKPGQTNLERYAAFFREYSGKPLRLFIAGGTYDIWHRLKAGNAIDSLYRKTPNEKITFRYSIFPGEHNSLVGQSMQDALRFLFGGYKDFETFRNDLIRDRNYAEAKNGFVRSSNTFGDYQPSGEDLDILSDIVAQTKDVALFEQWLQTEDPVKQLFTNGTIAAMLTDISPEKASAYFERAILAKEKGLLKLLPILSYNEATTLKKPKEAIRKLQFALTFLPEKRLEINYLIARNGTENHVEEKTVRAAIRYCEKHYRDNPFFTAADLELLKTKR